MTWVSNNRIMSGNQAKNKQFLTTKEVATYTGMSASYFEKARIYNYGPKFIRLAGSGKSGKVLYREEDVQAWLASQEVNPAEVSYE